MGNEISKNKVFLKKIRLVSLVTLTILILSAFATLGIGEATAYSSPIQHVLLISVDGLHQSDLEWYVYTHPNSELAKLIKGGMEYSNAQTTTPSDSFPSTVGLMTGGTPNVTGIYYDDAYNQADYPAGTTSCKGPTGATVTYDSPDDLNASALDAGQNIPGINQNPALIMDMTGNPQTVLNASTFPVNPVTCEPIWPHSYLQVNMSQAPRDYGQRGPTSTQCTRSSTVLPETELTICSHQRSTRLQWSRMDIRTR